MTTQIQSRIISLSAELARSDDEARHQSATRWHEALHRLCVIRATTNQTSYDSEWEHIFEPKTLMADVHRSKLLCFAALDVLEVQHEHSLMVCRQDGSAFDEKSTDEFRELLAAYRFKVENDLP